MKGSKYIKLLEKELLQSLHPNQSEKVIIDSLVETKWVPLEAHERLTIIDENSVVVTSDDTDTFDFLDFLEPRKQVKSVSESVSESVSSLSFPIMIQKTVLLFEYLVLPSKLQFDIFLSKHHEYLCVDLTLDCLQFASSGKKSNIAIVVAYLDSLLRFLSLHFDPIPLKIAMLHCFDLFSTLLFSFCDVIRQKALKFFFTLCGIKRDTSLFPIYIELFDFKNWYDLLKEFTFESKCIPIQRKEAMAILTQNAISRFGNKQLSNEEKDSLLMLKERIQGVIDEFNSPVFVKLSTRSPKDAGFSHPDYETMKSDMMEKWKVEYGYQDLPKSVVDSISQICCATCLQVKNGEDALDLMLRSARTLFDLQLTVEQYQEEFSLELVVRKWTELSLHTEVRSFIRDGKMTSASQYFSFCYFPWVKSEHWKSLIEKIQLKFI
jgi:hypothetical protein